MKTLIVTKDNMWILMIKKDKQVIKSWSFKKLIEALDTAFILQLHVANVDSLPLGGYVLRE